MYNQTQTNPTTSWLRPGKKCTAQVINLTQHLEDGFEIGFITGVACVDLTVAYETVNRPIMTNKINDITNDYDFTRVIEIFSKIEGTLWNSKAEDTDEENDRMECLNAAGPIQHLHKRPTQAIRDRKFSIGWRSCSCKTNEGLFIGRKYTQQRSRRIINVLPGTPPETKPWENSSLCIPFKK